MNSTSELTTLFDHSFEKEPLFEEIKDWIGANTFSLDQCYVWHIGISTKLSISDITHKVLGDIQCKHFRCWQAESFRKAMRILSRLNKNSFVFKSEMSDYTGKGKHIFIYKTACVSKNLFYHTLHQ